MTKLNTYSYGKGMEGRNCRKHRYQIAWIWIRIYGWMSHSEPCDDLQWLKIIKCTWKQGYPSDNKHRTAFSNHRHYSDLPNHTCNSGSSVSSPDPARLRLCLVFSTRSMSSDCQMTQIVQQIQQMGQMGFDRIWWIMRGKMMKTSTIFDWGANCL